MTKTKTTKAKAEALEYERRKELVIEAMDDATGHIVDNCILDMLARAAIAAMRNGR